MTGIFLLLLLIAAIMLFGAAVVRGFFGAIGVYLLIALTASAVYLLLVYFFGKFDVFYLFLGAFVIFIVGGGWAKTSIANDKRRTDEMNAKHREQRLGRDAEAQKAGRSRRKQTRKYLRNKYKEENP